MPADHSKYRSKSFTVMFVPDSGRTRSMRTSYRLTYSLLCLFIVSLSLGGWGVYSSYQAEAYADHLSESKTQTVALRLAHEQQVAKLQRLLEEKDQQLTFYARDIGQMQASLARLDALGSRLVKAGSLSESEFNFGLDPAFGGPRLKASAVMEELGVRELLSGLESRMASLDRQLLTIDYLLQHERSVKSARPQAWPTEGGYISSRYGKRSDPFTGKPATHRGVDIANRFGAPVLAASHGIVLFAGKKKDYGYVVEVAHGYGYVTRYGHLNSISVAAGDKIEHNQLLGRIGSSGRSTGPHLHYEVHHNGHHQNPSSFLPHS